MLMYKFIIIGLLLALGVPISPAWSQVSEQVVNIYSSRHNQTDEALYNEFTQLTGIRVNHTEASGDALIERIENEGFNSPADVYISVGAGNMWRAENAGILAPVHSRVLDESISNNLRHFDGLWFGFSTHTRLIIYNKALINPMDIASYEGLANPKWHGLVCISSSAKMSNLSLLASLIAHNGTVEAEAWTKGVVHHFARSPQGGDSDQIRAVASGECGITLASSYYYGRLMRSNSEDDKAVIATTGAIFPNQNGRGTHVDISGVGMVATAPHPEAAVMFLEYLTSEAAQKYFANDNIDQPLVEVSLEDEANIVLDQFIFDNINVSVFGRNQAEAQQIFDRAGWK